MNEVVADRYGVMGCPVSHSRSPIIHHLFAQQTHQHIQYELIGSMMIDTSIKNKLKRLEMKMIEA